MEVGKLNVKLRSKTGKGISRVLRREGLVPGICYGAGLPEPLKITVHPKALKASLDPEKGKNTVIDVHVEGGSKTPIQAMLWDYQVDAIRRDVIHFDLVAIDADKKIEVEVPLVTSGKAPGHVEGGQLHYVRHDVPVLCRPKDVPSKFVLDISKMELNDVIFAKDLDVPAGVELQLADDFGLLTMHPPDEEKEPEPVEAAEGAEGAEGADKDKADAKDDKGDDKKGDK